MCYSVRCDFSHLFSLHLNTVLLYSSGQDPTLALLQAASLCLDWPDCVSQGGELSGGASNQAGLAAPYRYTRSFGAADGDRVANLRWAHFPPRR